MTCKYNKYSSKIMQNIQKIFISFSPVFRKWLSLQNLMNKNLVLEFLSFLGALPQACSFDYLLYKVSHDD